MVGIAGTVAVVVVIAIGFASCGGRDDKAYQDGADQAWQAEMLLKASDGVIEDETNTPSHACGSVFRASHTRGMDQDDWIEGCTDQIMAHPGAKPWQASTAAPTTVIYDPSTSVYAPPPSAAPGGLSPTAQAILSARVDDCVKRVNGGPIEGGRTAVEVSLASCSGTDATDVVRYVYFTDGEPPCRTLWVRNRSVSPAKVLCLEPLR